MNDSHSHSKYKATQYTSCKHRTANTHIQSNAFAFKTAVFVSLRDSEGPIQRKLSSVQTMMHQDVLKQTKDEQHAGTSNI